VRGCFDSERMVGEGWGSKRESERGGVGYDPCFRRALRRVVRERGAGQVRAREREGAA
jgi:hypothetical protein